MSVRVCVRERDTESVCVCVCVYLCVYHGLKFYLENFKFICDIWGHFSLIEFNIALMQSFFLIWKRYNHKSINIC